MSYPYLSDLINSIFGTQLHIPIAMFGAFVALAIIVATAIAKQEVLRCERAGLLSSARLADGSEVPAHSIVSNLALVCAIWGIVGARMFHILEYPAEFVADPMGMLLSRGGFSIYGGLIVGAIAGVLYTRRRAVRTLPMLDAVAPALALGYGIGRIGCQVAGDGDWGTASNMLLKPEWLPGVLWAQTYTNNIAGVLIESPGVYPTPLYEAFMALLICGVLWGCRYAAWANPGFTFSLYLVLSGFARLLIEKIRINADYHFLGVSFTQAELISTALIVAGVVGIWLTTRAHYLPKAAFAITAVAALSACAGL